MKREYLTDRVGRAGKAGSVWLAQREYPQHDPLTEVVAADVVVVGAGICGVLTAKGLANRGADVVLLEARRIGSAVSGHTTAKATAQHGLLTARLSVEHASAWLGANVAAVDLLENWCAKTRDGAAYERTSSHVYATDSASRPELALEARLFEEAGLTGGLVSQGDLPHGADGAVWLDGQAQLDPVALLDQLLADGEGRLRVYEGSRVGKVAEQDNQVSVKTQSGEVRAAIAIFASHVPFFDTMLYMTRVIQKRTYALEVEVEREPPPGMWYSLIKAPSPGGRLGVDADLW